VRSERRGLLVGLAEERPPDCRDRKRDRPGRGEEPADRQAGAKDFRWTTRRSWSRARRVVGKAEFTEDEANPRFVVTSLKRAECKPKYLYERLYCARGDMENRIKECQLDLYADRTSTATMRANQLRLRLASFAYVLFCAVRRIGLHHTPFANASCGTIRLKLLKFGALVRSASVASRSAMASSCAGGGGLELRGLRLAAASARGSDTRRRSAERPRHYPRPTDMRPVLRCSPQQIPRLRSRPPDTTGRHVPKKRTRHRAMRPDRAKIM